MTEQRAYATVEELTADAPLPEDDVLLPSGRRVRVRGLTRAEAHRMNAIEGAFETERYALSRGLVIPRMNEPQVEAWIRSSVAGELNPASERITQLSGMSEDADKRAVRDFESGAVDEFRVLPSDQAQSNGSGATSDDQQ